jgi:hypothetical protein
MTDTPRKTRSMTSNNSLTTESKEFLQKDQKQKTPSKNGTQKKEPKAKANNRINGIFSPTSLTDNIRTVNSTPASHMEGSNNLLVLDGSLEAPPRNPTGKYEDSSGVKELAIRKNSTMTGGESDIPAGAWSPTEKTGPPVEGKKTTITRPRLKSVSNS